MRRRQPFQRWIERSPRVLLAAGLCWLHACSLVVSTDELEQGCPADRKPCGGVCVSRSDPEYGCTADGCRPCVIAQATARCSEAGVCVVASCQGDFADCNGDGDSPGSDGCEIDTAHDPNHCGTCEAEPCVVSNGAPACAGGVCSIRQCDDGYRDCNFDATDGCERRLASRASCP